MASETQAAAELYQWLYNSLDDRGTVDYDEAIAAAGYPAGIAILKDAGPVTEIFPRVVDVLLRAAGEGEAAPEVPPKHQRGLRYIHLLERFRSGAEAIFARHAVPTAAAPFVCAAAAARLIKESEIDPAAAKAIAIQAMTAGSKMRAQP